MMAQLAAMVIDTLVLYYNSGVDNPCLPLEVVQHCTLRAIARAAPSWTSLRLLPWWTEFYSSILTRHIQDAQA